MVQLLESGNSSHNLYLDSETYYQLESEKELLQSELESEEDQLESELDDDQDESDDPDEKLLELDAVSIELKSVDRSESIGVTALHSGVELSEPECNRLFKA